MRFIMLEVGIDSIAVGCWMLAHSPPDLHKRMCPIKLRVHVGIIFILVCIQTLKSNSATICSTRVVSLIPGPQYIPAK